MQAVEETETAAVRMLLADHGARHVSSLLVRIQSLRAIRHQEPQVLRTLDTIHLATAPAVGDDLEAIVTYDERMLDASRLLWLPTVTPR
jgi:predicted nucleic acid-binding protein